MCSWCSFEVSLSFTQMVCSLKSVPEVDSLHWTELGTES